MAGAEQAEADFESTSGQVAVWSMHTGRMEDVIRLADSGGSRRVRVSCAGRAEAAALSASEDTAAGVERYLIRFWPVVAQRAWSCGERLWTTPAWSFQVRR